VVSGESSLRAVGVSDAMPQMRLNGRNITFTLRIHSNAPETAKCGQGGINRSKRTANMSTQMANSQVSKIWGFLLLSIGFAAG
jgi:hypothetical protein